MTYPANAYPCRITRAIDGDTVICAIDEGFRNSTTQSIRLLDCWAPELREPGGTEARDFVRLWADQHQPLAAGDWPLMLTCEGHQSFARWLGRIRAPDTPLDLSAAVVFAGHATTTRTTKETP